MSPLHQLSNSWTEYFNLQMNDARVVRDSHHPHGYWSSKISKFGSWNGQLVFGNSPLWTHSKWLIDVSSTVATYKPKAQVNEINGEKRVITLIIKIKKKKTKKGLLTRHCSLGIQCLILSSLIFFFNQCFSFSFQFHFWIYFLSVCLTLIKRVISLMG
jgi:hypothetical protein